MALLLHLRLRSRRRGNPSLILFFSTSNSNSPFSSLFRDIKGSLKQPSPRKSEQASADAIRKNLNEFRSRTGAPPPGDRPQEISLQELYLRNMQQNPGKSGEASIGVQFIRGSLKNLRAGAQTSPGLLRPTPSDLPDSVFGREMRREGSVTTTTKVTAFLKTYAVEDLGKKLRMLRPEEKGKDWFSISELSERLVRLRKMEEEQAHSSIRDGVGVAAQPILQQVRDSLVEMDQRSNDKSKKATRL